MLNFEKTADGNLRITFAEGGKEEALDVLECGGCVDPLLDLMTIQLCNGWQQILPREIGAFTDATIISEDVERDEYDDIVKFGRVYSNIDYYQTEGDVERLFRLGEIVWRGFV
jgi:hypothetical protein